MERIPLIPSTADTAVADSASYDDVESPRLRESDIRTSRGPKYLALVATAVLAGSLLILGVNDQAGAGRVFSGIGGKFTRGVGLYSSEAESGETLARLGRGSASRRFKPIDGVVDQMTAVPMTESTAALGRAVKMIQVEDEKHGSRVLPSFLKRWHKAPFWNSHQYIPVHRSPKNGIRSVVVVGHATNMTKYAGEWLASAAHWGLPASISGHGTHWTNWEEKTMGLRTNLEHMEGEPIVVASDTGDVLFSCTPEDLAERFEAADADMIVSGETQLYPEVKSYFEKNEDMEWSNTRNILGEIGRAAEAKPVRGERPYHWANAGLIMGRRSALIKYISEVEDLLVDMRSKDERFPMSCRPYEWTDEQTREKEFNNGFYDDQLCLNAYAMKQIINRNTRFKIDQDGSILHSPGGIDMNQMKQNPKTGRVYNAETGKSPCAWHFNNPNSKDRMIEAIEKYPNYFVSTQTGAQLLVEGDLYSKNKKKH